MIAWIGKAVRVEGKVISAEDLTIDGDVEGGSLMAGQSVGMVKEEEPVAQIVATLIAESEEALTRR